MLLAQPTTSSPWRTPRTRRRGGSTASTNDPSRLMPGTHTARPERTSRRMSSTPASRRTTSSAGDSARATTGSMTATGPPTARRRDCNPGTGHGTHVAGNDRWHGVRSRKAGNGDSCPGLRMQWHNDHLRCHHRHQLGCRRSHDRARRRQHEPHRDGGRRPRPCHAGADQRRGDHRRRGRQRCPRQPERPIRRC